MKKILTVAALALPLVACKADLIEVRLNSSELAGAIAGEKSTARFIANFSAFGELDDEQRRQIDTMEEIVEENVSVDDFQITRADYNTNITVEGELPIVLGEPGSSKETFAVYITPSDNPLLPGFAYSVQLGTGAAFKRMESDMQDVSFMLAIDDVQPVQYRLRADSVPKIQVLAGGVQIDGENHALHTIDLEDGDRVNMTFSGGAYDSVSGQFLISAP